MSGNEVEFLMIKTYLLKVHMHCQGCQKKVKKILRKIEGVYSVNIDAENQVVTISGSVDSDTLIKKLATSGKYANLLSPNSSQKPNKGRANIVIDDNNRINRLNAPKTENIFPNSDNYPQEQRSPQNYINQNNIGASAVSGLIHQNLMEATKSKTPRIGDYVDTLATEDDMKFSERTVYGDEPVMMSGMQQWYHYNRPTVDMMQPNNTMDNLNYMHQNHMMNYNSPLIPCYKDFGFSYAPDAFY